VVKLVRYYKQSRAGMLLIYVVRWH